MVWQFVWGLRDILVAKAFSSAVSIIIVIHGDFHTIFICISVWWIFVHCHLQNISSILVDQIILELSNMKYLSVHHFKYLLVKCRSGLIGCDDLSGRLNIICPKTCPVNPKSTPPMATLDFDPLRTTTMGIRTALHYDDFLQRTVKSTVFICIQYICDNRTSVGLVHHMQGMLHCMILKYQVESSCISPLPTPHPQTSSRF